MILNRTLIEIREIYMITFLNFLFYSLIVKNIYTAISRIRLWGVETWEAEPELLASRNLENPRCGASGRRKSSKMLAAEPPDAEKAAEPPDA